MGQIFNREQIAPTVACLQQPDGTGSVKTGTASFVVDGDRAYVLTASHVANDMRIDGAIILGDKESNPIVLKWPDLISGAPKLNWIHHPVGDLAIIELRPNPQISKEQLQGRFIPRTMICSTQDPPDRDTHLTSIGFPLGLGTTGFFSPLTFESKASSALVTLPRVDTKRLSPFFILQDPSIGGYSGGPVYDLSIVRMGLMASRGDGTVLHGVMHGTLSDDTGGKLAAVTPAYLINDLLP